MTLYINIDRFGDVDLLIAEVRRVMRICNDDAVHRRRVKEVSNVRTVTGSVSDDRL